jgi:hypothetical protein
MEPRALRRWHAAARRSGELFYADASNILMSFISSTAISSHPRKLLRQQRTLHQVQCLVHKIVLAANTSTDGSSVSQPSLHYGGSYLMNAIQAIQTRQQADTASGPRDELRKYLKSGVESTTDVVGWWGVSFLRIFECTHVLIEPHGQYHVPDAETDCARLPCDPGVSYSI